jgi:molybdopterin synthase sulfur carrier subunit
MNLKILAFAASSDAFGFSKYELACEPDDTPLRIVMRIAPQVDRTFLRVALDGEFVTWDTPVADARELAFLPPVSGG